VSYPTGIDERSKKCISVHRNQKVHAQKIGPMPILMENIAAKQNKKMLSQARTTLNVMVDNSTEAVNAAKTMNMWVAQQEKDAMITDPQVVQNLIRLCIMMEHIAANKSERKIMLHKEQNVMEEPFRGTVYVAKGMNM